MKFIEKLINQSCSLNNKRQKHKAGRDEGRRLKQENSQKENRERETGLVRSLKNEKQEASGERNKNTQTDRK